MNISVKLLESIPQISKMIASALQPEVDKALVIAGKKSIDSIRALLIEALKAEPEYQSLTSGKLRLEFGIPNPGSIDSIIEKLGSTISIENLPTKITSNGLNAGFKIIALKSDDMNGLLSDNDAVVTDSERGYSLPWLSWLLYEGNKPIIKNYSVRLGNNPYSRTGMAIMVDSQDSWRVPPEFAGTTNSNWTTRAIDRISSRISDILRKSIEDSI